MASDKKPSKASIIINYEKSLKVNGKKGNRTEDDLKEHEKVALLLKCPSCDTWTSSIDSYIQHQKIHIKGPKERFQYLCNLCSYSSPVMDHLRKHLMRHYDIKPFKCRICDWTCVTKYQLKQHSLSHLNLKRSRYAH